MSVQPEGRAKASLQNWEKIFYRLFQPNFPPALESGASRISSFLEDRGKGIGLRLGIKTHGCSGMAYILEFVDETDEYDNIFEVKGLKIIVDDKSLVYIDGTELDFRKEGLNEGFVFNNPNASGECGCGESFTV